METNKRSGQITKFEDAIKSSKREKQTDIKRRHRNWKKKEETKTQTTNHNKQKKEEEEGQTSLR